MTPPKYNYEGGFIVSLIFSDIFIVSCSNKFQAFIYKTVYHEWHYLMRVSWKVDRLTKIFSWNVTKWCLFFNIVSLAVHTLLSSVLQCLDLEKQVISSRYVVTWTFQSTVIFILKKKRKFETVFCWFFVFSDNNSHVGCLYRRNRKILINYMMCYVYIQYVCP